MLRLLIAISFFVLSIDVAYTQGTQADYDRAAKLGERYQGKALNVRPLINWSASGDQIVYRQSKPDGSTHFVQLDVVTGKRTPAFDHERLAAELSKATKKTIQATKLPFTVVEMEKNPDVIYFQIDGVRWQYDRVSYLLTKKGAAPPPATQQRRLGFGRSASRESPDGVWKLAVKDHNVQLINVKSNASEALTKDGTAEVPYIEQFFWSPDSKKVMLQRVKPAQEHKIQFVESSPRGQVQPKVHEMNYLKPGDELAKPQLVLVDIASRKKIDVDKKLYDNLYSLTMFQWAKDSSRFTFLFNQRGHQVVRWLGVDANTGNVQAIIDEQSKSFVDYAGKMYLHQVEGKPEAIWMSERDGWNHLYLFDTKAGKVQKQLTQGPWVVRKVVKADDASRTLWFTCGGFYAEQDPYQLHLGKVNYDGTGLTILTSSDAYHATELSPNGKYFVDYASRVDLPTVTSICSARDGKVLAEVEKADVSALEKDGWKPPERFVALGRDGKTPIYGIIHWPSNYREALRYPVIENIYAGPHDAHVPKEFRPFYRLQTIADLGFIVVQIDGMGTSQRSKAFHDVCWKNLGDAGFPDRIAWIKSAAAKHPSMDLTRVGIYGGSAGGQNAMRGMLMYPEFYKVGVADCGCHDNRMDKIWWNELWMSWPIGPHYAESSNVTHAHKLQGKLLLTVGEMDRNVDPASTMQVVDALVKANKDFDMLVIPGGGHGVAESPYGSRRRQDYFVRHLLGVEPRGR
jgi:dipeptidyl aminopeptidase/acylaminoacyl peptidase